MIIRKVIITALFAVKLTFQLDNVKFNVNTNSKLLLFHLLILYLMKEYSKDFYLFWQEYTIYTLCRR